MGGVLKAIAPVASLIPGVGSIASVGAGLLGNALDPSSGGGGSSGSSSGVQNALTAAQVAQAAKDAAANSAGYTKDARAADTTALDNVLAQAKTLFSQSKDPSSQAQSATLNDPSKYYYVNPQTQTSVIPSSYGAQLTNTDQGVAPNSYQSVIGKGLGTTAPPTPLATQTGLSGAAGNNPVGTPGAPAAAAPTSWTPAQQAAINAAVNSSLSGIQGGETVGQIGNLAQAALSKSGLFSADQAAALGQAAQWDSHGAGFREQGSNAQPFQAAELAGIANNYQGAYGAPAATPAAAPATAKPVAAPAIAAQPPATRQATAIARQLQGARA